MQLFKFNLKLILKNKYLKNKLFILILYIYINKINKNIILNL